MFDDVKNKKQDNTIPAGPSPAQPKQDSAQSNVGAVSIGGKDKKTEDIFADIDQPAKPDVFQPKAKEADSSAIGGKKGKTMPASIGEAKKYIIIATVVFGAVLIAYAGYWAYGKYFKATDLVGEEVSDGIEEQASESKTIDPEQPASAQEELEKEQVAPTPVEQPKDSDQDGLTDEEEEQLGINSNSVDSDGDGLFDREEVEVYHTDPLNPDTDGDGFSDGDEVKDGYNPKGEGKLYKIE